jgi:hypothetical protein
MYVLTRNDLPLKYSAVQAGHAVAAFLLHDQQSWNNEYLIYLSVKNEEELKTWGEILTLKGIKWFGFKEPDINNELTAISTVCDKKVFSKLKLLC